MSESGIIRGAGTLGARQLRFLARDILPLVNAVIVGFGLDPGISDLDDEQPVWLSIPLGEYRRAVRLKPQLEATDAR